MNLVIFDLDGTLTDTTDVDDQCLVKALEDVVGVRGLSTDWSSYAHNTDSGIVHDVVSAHTGAVGESIVETINDRFHALLEDHYTATPERFRPMQGAQSILAKLRSANVAVAIATGSWRESALFKLRVAGVEHAGVPMATADDDMRRERIIMTAVQRASQQVKTNSFDRVIYVGDGVWDARAARVLEMPFIGIGTGSHAEVLRQQGARHVVANPSDVPFLLNLESAFQTTSRS